MKHYYLMTLCIISLSVHAQNKVMISVSQNNKMTLEKRFIVENSIMLANWDGEFIPVFNNTFSTVYYINDILGIGVFYDFFNINTSYGGQYFRGNSHITGIKIDAGLIPLYAKNISKKIPNLNITLNGYYGYNSKPFSFVYQEKKDLEKWGHFYRLNLRYFINPKFFISASSGLINSNRILLGIGFKL